MHDRLFLSLILNKDVPRADLLRSDSLCGTESHNGADKNMQVSDYRIPVMLYCDSFRGDEKKKKNMRKCYKGAAYKKKSLFHRKGERMKGKSTATPL